MNEARHQSGEVYLADLRRRLRPVCAEWPEETFERLLSRIVAIEMKYRARSGLDTLEARVTWPGTDTP
jgi:hypothetical protein